MSIISENDLLVKIEKGGAAHVVGENDFIKVVAKVELMRWKPEKSHATATVSELTSQQLADLKEWFTNLGKETRLFSVLEYATQRLSNECDGATSWDLDLSIAIATFDTNTCEFTFRGQLVRTRKETILEWMPSGAIPPYIYNERPSPVTAARVKNDIVCGLNKGMKGSGAYLYDREAHHPIDPTEPRRYYDNPGGPNLCLQFVDVQVYWAPSNKN